MSLKRVLACLGAMLLLVSVLALDIFAFENPGNEVPLFPGEPITPTESVIDISYGNLAVNETQIYTAPGRVEFGHKSTGVLSATYDITYYESQLKGPSFNFYYEFTIDFYNYSADNGSSKRVYVKPFQGQIRLSNGSISKYYYSGWSFSYDFTNNRLLVIDVSSNTVQSTTSVYYENVGVDNFYTDSNGIEKYYVSVPVRILMQGEAERASLYLRQDNYFVEMRTLRNVSNGRNFDMFHMQYSMFDPINTSGDQDIIISNIKIGDNFTYQYAYDDGYNSGYDEGYYVGEGFGYDYGFDDGYNAGLLDGGVSDLDLPQVITTTMNATVTLFRNIFGFELFGINISALVGSLALVSVLAWLIRKLVR